MKSEITNNQPERDALLTLLAILHSDGGHHTQEVGITQSVQDAHQVWARLLTERDSALQENARLRTALEQLRELAGIHPTELLSEAPVSPEPLSEAHLHATTD